MRYTKNAARGLAMAQTGFAEPRGIWVDCVKCGRRDQVTGDDTAAWSDARAKRFFAGKGWSVRPTECPDCAVGTEPIFDMTREQLRAAGRG